LDEGKLLDAVNRLTGEVAQVAAEIARVRKAICIAGLVVAMTNPGWASSATTADAIATLELLAKS